MKHFLMAVCLACVLSIPAFAGDIPMDNPTPPPPAPITAEIQSVNSTAPSDMPTSGLSFVLTLIELAF